MNLITKINYLTDNVQNTYSCKFAFMSLNLVLYLFQKRALLEIDSNTQLKWWVLLFSHIVHGLIHAA
jgi:hypothetical protein